VAQDLRTSRRATALRVGAAAAAAVIVAEGAFWLMRPREDLADPAPVSAGTYFGQAELRRAQDFRDTQRLIGLGSLVVEGVVLTTLALWRPAPVRRALDRAGRRPIIGGAAVGAGISLTLAVAGLPLGLVAHERARDVGLDTQSIGPWLTDQARAVAIAAGFAAAGGAAAMALVRWLGRRFWIGGMVVVVVFAVVFTWLAPVLLAPVFNRFQPLPRGKTRSEVLRLGRQAGVSIGQVYRVDASRRSTAVNAYVDGIGSSKRVVIYDNTLHQLSPAELRSVVAHELGHVKHSDIRRGLIFVAIIAPLGVLFVQLLTFAIARRRGDDIRSPAVLPALALSLALAMLVLGVPGNQLSRSVEANADDFALRLTHDPRAFIGLQKRLAVTNLADPSPPAALEFLFGTHPSTLDRIGAAVAYREEQRDGVSRPGTRAGS
jgi:STE24 endopeptidase